MNATSVQDRLQTAYDSTLDGSLDMRIASFVCLVLWESFGGLHIAAVVISIAAPTACVPWLSIRIDDQNLELRLVDKLCDVGSVAIVRRYDEIGLHMMVRVESAGNCWHSNIARTGVCNRHTLIAELESYTEDGALEIR